MMMVSLEDICFSISSVNLEAIISNYPVTKITTISTHVFTVNKYYKRSQAVPSHTYSTAHDIYDESSCNNSVYLV